MSSQRKIIITASLIVAFLLCFIYCITPLKIGIADDGSLFGTEQSFGLAKTDNSGFFNYKFEKTAPSGKIGGTMPLYLKLLRSISVSGFDSRLLGGFYILLMLAGAFMILKNVDLKGLQQNIFAAALMIIIFFDAAYLSYFNTLYAQAGFNVFVFVAMASFISLVLSEKHRILYLILFVVFAVLSCGFKINTAGMGIIYGLMLLLASFDFKDKLLRIVSIAAAVAVAAAPLAAFSGTDNPEYKNGLFNSVFYGILKNTENASEALSELNLPEELAALKGKSVYDKTEYDIESPEFQKLFYDNISYGKIVMYYIKHPSEYLKQFTVAANNGFQIRPGYLGNYPSESGKDINETAGGFSLYSFVKEKFFPAQLWLAYLVPLALIAVAVCYNRQISKKGVTAFLIGTALLMVYTFNVPMISYGEAGISKNMAVFSTLFDIGIYGFVLYMIYITTQRRKEFKEKYGANQ